MDITNQRFTRLTVVRLAFQKKGHFYWECLCDCGTVKIVAQTSLKQGNVQSCGCLGRERRRESRTTHGLTGIPEYWVYHHMIQRCYNERDVEYRNYGARGITVCDDWRAAFENFFASMGRRPSPKHSLERIDNEKGYAPDNCKWATLKEQNNNRRGNHRITVNNEPGTVTTLAEQRDIKPSTVFNRLSKGFTADDALTIKPSKGGWEARRTRAK